MTSVIQTIPMMRGCDCQGAGYFGASRAGGSRLHEGVDFISSLGHGIQLGPGDPVLALNEGKVTKLGYPYRHDLSFRYVQVTDEHGFDCRYFYIGPRVNLGDKVRLGQTLGVLQKLPYEGITQHYHFECLRPDNGEPTDPIPFLCGDAPVS